MSTAAIQDQRESTSGHEITVTAEAPLLVLSTTEDVRAGSVLLHPDMGLPESVHFRSKQYGSWKILTGVNGFEVERRLSEAGSHFFFMVPAISAGALSSDRNKALRKGLKTILTATEAQNFHALAIVEITTKRLLGLCYVKVIAHPRRVKHSPFLPDLDPYHMTQNVWDFKQVFRRRVQIGRTAKAV